MTLDQIIKKSLQEACNDLHKEMSVCMLRSKLKLAIEIYKKRKLEGVSNDTNNRKPKEISK